MTDLTPLWLDDEKSCIADLRGIVSTEILGREYYLLTMGRDRRWSLPGGIAQFSHGEFNKQTIEALLQEISRNHGLERVDVHLDKSESELSELKSGMKSMYVPLGAYHVEPDKKMSPKLESDVTYRWVTYDVASMLLRRNPAQRKAFRKFHSNM